MEDEIGQLKSVFRSLVVSSPTQVDVRSLLRDYRNMIGSPVPFRKYGYSNPVDFFKERFSDCFLFSGVTSNPVLTLIVPDTLKHIDKFVQKQKSSSTSKFNPKRRSVPEELVNINRDNSISKTNKQKHKLSQPIELSHEPHAKSFSKLNIRPIKSHESVSKPNIPPTKSYVSVSKPNISCSNQNGTMTSKMVNNAPCTDDAKHNRDINVVYCNEILEDKEETDRKPKDTPVDSTDAVKNFLKKRLPLYNSQPYLDEESTEHCSKTLKDDDSGRQTLSSSSSAKAQQLERLKQEIMKLIADAPDGVWCTDLLNLYKERYNRELNFSRFGYTSIISLVYCLERGVQITRPDDTGDWLLQERRSAAPPAPRPRRRAALLNQHHQHHQHLAADSDDALPGIDYDHDVFPEDCMHFMESIESMSVSDFRPGAMVEVMIGEVYSPSHFWFIRLGDNYNIAMEDMMDEMTRYYRNEGHERVLARGAVRVGHYCASVFEKDWHRSIIVKIIDSDTVKVRHIDYGTVDTLGLAQLRPLRREWARLPAQACRARLAAVRPPARGWRWPHAACSAFLALVTNKKLVANVVAVDDRDKVTEVLLIDTSSEQDVCIGSELTRAGHADARHDSALRTLDVYLFPRFEALESGATPNYAEVHAYLRDGIALDYVRAYRDHVPLPLQHDDRPSCRESRLAELHKENHHPHRKAHKFIEHPSYQEPASPYEQNSLYDSESPDSSEFTVNALDCAPPSPPETDVTESTSESGVPIRIPLFLPNTVSPPKTELPQTETDPVAVAEPELPTRSAEERPTLPPTSTQSTERPALLPTPTQSTERPALLPTPTSYLSPHAPAYVPGAPYRAPPHQEWRAPGPACPAGYVRSPPPPYGSPVLPLSTPGVTLSLAECETYRALSHVNPAAAHWFIVGAMGRATAMLPRPPGPYPPPPPMRPPTPSHTFPPQMLQVHPPVRIRPPPGFSSF